MKILEVNSKAQMLIWSTLTFLYLLIRFLFTTELDNLGTYASYIFEVFVVGVALLINRKKLFKIQTFQRFGLYFSLGAIISGYGIFKIAYFLKIQLPFDLDNRELLLFLLAIAPILEELIFRFFLWEPIIWITKRPAFAWILSSLIFSYSHFHAIWYAPKEIHHFIIYQTIYTFILGLTCGYSIYKNKSLIQAIFIHFAFNFGFYLGSIL